MGWQMLNYNLVDRIIGVAKGYAAEEEVRISMLDDEGRSLSPAERRKIAEGISDPRLRQIADIFALG